MKEDCEFNVNDIVETYAIITNVGLGKYLIVAKNVTKYRGIFYDLLTLNNIEDENPSIIRGVKLFSARNPNIHYRKYFDAQK